MALAKVRAGDSRRGPWREGWEDARAAVGTSPAHRALQATTRKPTRRDELHPPTYRAAVGRGDRGSKNSASAHLSCYLQIGHRRTLRADAARPRHRNIAFSVAYHHPAGGRTLHQRLLLDSTRRRRVDRRPRRRRRHQVRPGDRGNAESSKVSTRHARAATTKRRCSTSIRTRQTRRPFAASTRSCNQLPRASSASITIRILGVAAPPSNVRRDCAPRRSAYPPRELDAKDTIIAAPGRGRGAPPRRFFALKAAASKVIATPPGILRREPPRAAASAARTPTSAAQAAHAGRATFNRAGAVEWSMKEIIALAKPERPTPGTRASGRAQGRRGTPDGRRKNDRFFFFVATPRLESIWASGRGVWNAGSSKNDENGCRASQIAVQLAPDAVEAAFEMRRFRTHSCRAPARRRLDPIPKRRNGRRRPAAPRAGARASAAPRLAEGQPVSAATSCDAPAATPPGPRRRPPRRRATRRRERRAVHPAAEDDVANPKDRRLATFAGSTTEIRLEGERAVAKQIKRRRSRPGAARPRRTPTASTRCARGARCRRAGPRGGPAAPAGARRSPASGTWDWMADADRSRSSSRPVLAPRSDRELEARLGLLDRFFLRPALVCSSTSLDARRPWRSPGRFADGPTPRPAWFSNSNASTTSNQPPQTKTSVSRPFQTLK